MRKFLRSSRLARGTAANIFAQAVFVIIQIISVPAYTYAWGADLYGVWVLLYSIPAYLVLFDLGLATTAANDMTINLARGNAEQAAITFQSMLVAVAAVAFGILCLATLTILVLPDTFFAQPSSATRWACIIVVGYSMTILLGNAQQAGYRASGSYATGQLIQTATMLIEAVCSISAAVSGAGLLICAAVLFCVRSTSLVFVAAYLVRTTTWLTLSPSGAKWAEVRRLAPVAVATMLMPATYAINLQGILFVIGATLAPSSVAIFAATRTIARAGLQFGTTVNHALLPEFSMAVGKGDSQRKARLFALNWILCGGLLFVHLAIMVCFGEKIIETWTGGRIDPPAIVVIGLSIAMALQGVEYFLGNLLLSANLQRAYLPILFVISVLTLALAAFLSRAAGLGGCVLALCIGELAMSIYIYRKIARFDLGHITEIPRAFPILARELLARLRLMSG